MRLPVGQIEKVAGKRINIKHVPGPVGVHSRNFANDRIYSIGWKPKVYLEQGIELLYPWIEEQVRIARTKES
jgi:nucleoside-diphosphate-sugar epimerase